MLKKMIALRSKQIKDKDNKGSFPNYRQNRFA